jgi:pimeloyl-ACP methyl ester carboxylesterase
VQLAARRFGSTSSPVALLVHGASDASSTWWRVGPWLAERGFDVIAVDLRGHGGSGDDLVRTGDAFTQAADDLVDTVAAIRPDFPNVELLAAHSLGTVVGLTCVARHPSFVRRLAIEEPPGASLPFALLKDRVAETIRGARGDSAALTAIMRGHGLDDREVQARVQGLVAADPDYVSLLIGTLAKVDTARLAARCSLPVLVMVGRDLGEPLSAPDGEQLAGYSHLSGADRARFLAGLPAATVVQLDGGHNLHQALFRQYTAVLARWLDGGWAVSQPSS